MMRLAICLLVCLLAAGVCSAAVYTGTWDLEGVNPGYNPGINHDYGLAVDGNNERWVAANQWSMVRFMQKVDPDGWSTTNRSNTTGSHGSNTVLGAFPDGDLFAVSKDQSGIVHYTYDHATATWSGATRMGGGADFPIGSQNLLVTGNTLQDVHYIAGGGDHPRHIYHDGTDWVSEIIFQGVGAEKSTGYYTMTGRGHTLRQTSGGQLKALVFEGLTFGGWDKRLSIFSRAPDGSWSYEAVPGANPMGSPGFTNGWVTPGAFALVNDRPLVVWPKLGGSSTDGYVHLMLSYKDSTGTWQQVQIDPDALNGVSNNARDSIGVDIEISDTGVLAIAYTDYRYGPLAADPADRARVKVAYLDLTEIDLDDPSFVDQFTFDELYIYDPTVPGSWSDDNPIGSGYRNTRIEFSHDDTMLNVLFQARDKSGRTAGFFASTELTVERQQDDPSAVPEPVTLVGLALGAAALVARRRRAR